MFPEAVSQFSFVILAMLAVAGLAWVFVYPYLSGDIAAAQRLDRVTNSPGQRGANANGDLNLRKKSVENSLKELEKRQGNIEANPPLAMRLEQTGLGWGKATYYIFSAVCGIVIFVVAIIPSGSVLSAILSGCVAFISLPRWYINYIRKRRFRKFLDEFANALDVITRGVKAGLPVTDCMRICSQESMEPVRSEFRQVLEMQSLNIPLDAAVEMMYQRVPLPETNFFSIVIAVQQKSGGNLSEVLTNLSKVLRDRKRLQGKIRAMAQEFDRLGSYYRFASSGRDHAPELSESALHCSAVGRSAWPDHAFCGIRMDGGRRFRHASHD